ncbi:MAG: hypothetical protein MUF45_02620 [Spirosomaceae bacterium]|jgi:hypothetical protein|nr:hypothetical protein [Spirosomataceae bacterium]
MKTILKISFVAVFFLLIACSKEDPAPTKTQLISRKWNTESVTAVVSGLQLNAYTKGGSNNLINFSNFTATLSTDGSISMVNPTNGQLINGKWVFEQNETVVNVSNGLFILTIQELTQNKMIFKMPYEIPTDDYKAFGLSKGMKIEATFTMSSN